MPCFLNQEADVYVSVFPEKPAWLFNQISTYLSKWKNTSKQATAIIHIRRRDV